MSFGDDVADRPALPNLLDAFPRYVAAVRAHIEAGRVQYESAVVERPPVQLGGELEREALDLAGFGFVLFCRLEELKIRAARLDSQERNSSR